MITLHKLTAQRKLILPLLTFGLVFALYLRTLAPTVFGLDSAEMTLGAYTLGIVHAPGYPVYLMLAHLFTYIPVGDIAYRVNLFSAFSGALLVGSLVWMLLILVKDWRHALSAALAFAFIYYQWTVSIAAEVYALQGLLFSAILIAALGWRRRRATVFVAATALLTALAAVNNPATVMWWPGLLYLMASGEPKPRINRHQGALVLLALFLGSLPLLYLPLRAAAQPAFSYAGAYDVQGIFHPLDLSDPANLIWYLSGSQFGWLFPGWEVGAWLRSAGALIQHFWSAFLGVGVPLGLWGAWRLRHQDRRLLTGLALVILPYLIFFTGYQAPDTEFMLLPFYIVWTLLLALGMEGLFSYTRSAWRWLGTLLPVALLITNWGFVDASGATTLRQVAASRLRAVEPDAFYLATWGDASLMHYLQQVEGLRRDVRVINVFFIEEQELPNLIEFALNNHYNVYLARSDILPGDAEALEPVGHGYRFTTTEPAP